MLASDRDGEVVAAARAIRRTLESEKLDIHALAETIETSSGPRAGVPDWAAIASTCQAHPSRLFGDKERKFVDDMVHRTRARLSLSEKQQAWLKKIYIRVRK
jgi:hypothetical protein